MEQNLSDVAAPPRRTHRMQPQDVPVALVAGALVLFPFARHPAEAVFIAAVVAAGVLGWPAGDRDRIRRLVGHGVILVLLSAWVIARVQPPWGTGLHSLGRTTLYPVTLLDYLPFLWAFFLLSWNRFTARHVRIVCWALVATVPVYAVLVFGQMHLAWRAVWAWDAWGVPILELTMGPARPGRATGGHPNANVLGVSAWYGLVASMTLLWASRSRGMAPADGDVGLAARAGGSRSSAARALLAQGMAVLGGLASLWILYQSGSRIAWAVAAVALLVGALLLPTRTRAVVLVALVLAGGLVLLSVRDDGQASEVAREIVPEVIWGRIAGSDTIRPSRLQWRVHVWTCGRELVAERPVMGFGLGTFGAECEQRLGDLFDVDVPPGTLNHAHNLFLQIATELGLVFTLVVSGWIAWLLWPAIPAMRRGPPEERRLRAGVLALVIGVLAISQVNLAVAHDHRLATTFWVAMAMLVGPLGRARLDHADRPHIDPDE